MISITSSTGKTHLVVPYHFNKSRIKTRHGSCIGMRDVEFYQVVNEDGHPEFGKVIACYRGTFGPLSNTPASAVLNAKMVSKARATK